jgi:hypothetical protein
LRGKPFATAVPRAVNGPLGAAGLDAMAMSELFLRSEGFRAIASVIP